MRSTVEILDALKRHFSVTSDYAVAKKMGWSRARVSSYRTQRSFLEPWACYQAASILKQSCMKFIAIAEAERAERTKRPEEKRGWQELAKASMLATALIAGGVFATPGTAQAASSTIQFNPDIHYATRRKRGPFYDNLPKDPLLAAHA